MNMSANYMCGFVPLVVATRLAVFCLIRRSVVGLEALCAITTVISDLVLSLLTMTGELVTLLRPQNSVEINKPSPLLP